MLLQKREDRKFNLVQAGSYAISAMQLRYSASELEAYGIITAVGKCEYCLRGLEKFKVMTDHRSLIEEGVAVHNKHKAVLVQRETEYIHRLLNVCIHSDHWWEWAQKTFPFSMLDGLRQYSTNQ